MPWCPDCKNEYNNDIQTCSDCNSTLVDSLDNVTTNDVKIIEIETEEIANKFIKYLQYCNIDSGTLILNKSTGTYLIFVDEEDETQARKYYKAFKTVELEEPQGVQPTVSEEESIEEELFAEDEQLTVADTDSNKDAFDEFEDEFNKNESNTKALNSRGTKTKELKKGKKNSGVYVKKRDQYNDLRSTFTLFTCAAIIGFVFLLLNAFKVLQIYNNPLQYIVTALMFVAFLYVGISSLLRSKKVYTEISEEEALTEQLTQWLISNITLENLNQSITEHLSDEMLFYKHLEIIKDRINNTFGEIDDAYLDYVVEDFYNTHIEI